MNTIRLFTVEWTDTSEASQELRFGSTSQYLIKQTTRIYRENHFPNEWRNAIITPIFKKGDRREPKNYRGISILNTCYKVNSKIRNMKLRSYSELLMTETQNGFRKGPSCTDPKFWSNY